MRRLLPFWWGFLGMLVAGLCIGGGLTMIHLWSDHQAFHVLLNYLNEHATKINRLP